LGQGASRARCPILERNPEGDVDGFSAFILGRALNPSAAAMATAVRST
jgi:hypothetical protein